MRLIVFSSIRVEEPSEALTRFCRDTLVLPNPDYVSAERMGRWTGGMEKELCLYSEDGGDLILPFGCLEWIWPHARQAKAGWRTEFHPFIGGGLSGHVSLYDYQERAVSAMVKAKSGVLEAPCGSGKTQMGLAIIERIGGRALWLTHTKKLLKQSEERAKAYLQGGFGEITEGKVRIGEGITFATVQTMSKLDPSLYRDAFDIVVVDECHHCAGSPTRMAMFYQVITNCNARYKYGLSATLTRADGLIRSVYAAIGPKRHSVSKEEVGDKTIKAEHVRVDVGIDYPMESWCGSDGMLDFNALINTLSEDAERNAIIVSKARELWEGGRKQLILCHRVAQAENLAKACSSFAKVSLMTGRVSEKKRVYDAEIIVATYALAKEGLDIPDLDAVHLATPQKDESTVRQSVGRVERNVPGKRKPLAIDYVDVAIPYCLSCWKKRRRILARDGCYIASTSNK